MVATIPSPVAHDPEEPAPHPASGPIVAPAPLWDPIEERTFRTAALGDRPDDLDGIGAGGWFRMLIGRSPLTIAIRVANLVAVVALLLFTRDLAAGASWRDLAVNLTRHLWTVLLLLAVTFPVRRLRTVQLARYLSLGLMLGPIIVHHLYGPLTDLITTDDPDVWVVPVLEELVKVLPVVILLAIHRRLRLRYGIADLLVIGFVLGTGFALTEDALYDRLIGTGFGEGWGLLLPSAFVRPDGSIVVGHAVWTALAAVGLGLLVIHRRRPIAVVGGAVLLIAPILDHVIANDFDWIAPWAHHVLRGDSTMPILFLSAVAAAVALDLRSLRPIRRADHLLAPPGRHLLETWFAPGRRNGARIAGLRYLRKRNGVHHRRAAAVHPWPNDRSGVGAGELPSLARLGRRAGIVDGALPVEAGWAEDPVAGNRLRWHDRHGWTPYVHIGDRRTGTPALEPVPGRPEVIPEPARTAGPTWIRDVAILTGALGAFLLYRIWTGTEPEPDVFQFAPSTRPGGGPIAVEPPGSAPWWGSLPGSGNPPPGPGLPGGPASGPPAPPPPPDPGGPPPPSPDAPPPGPDGPPDGPPPDDPPDDGPPDDDEDDPEEECP